ncbi:MAG: hypothetical protein Q9160_004137 [Pyrenula sp. 1 TL-2023]
MMKRFGLMLINIVFPPLGILLLCGPESDMIINCVLFILAVIPSHIHAFYISMTYFHRKSKVRKGQWPGPWKSFIYSEKVQNGGASASQVRKLKQAQQAEGTGEKLVRRLSGRSNGRSSSVGKGGVMSEKIPSRSSSMRSNGVVRQRSQRSHNGRVNGQAVPQRTMSGRSVY